jgi:hypothetical protein
MRDPVSGNEVPPGSMASEVRDDVPAMLSEGEYIVPADVVRYYGVKFFEDLRGQAKSGLMDMERNGRIGGEPVPGPGPGMEEEELSPEEMQMLAELTGMYAGGDVRSPQRDTMSVEEVLSSNMSVYDAINSPVRVFTPEGQEATTPEMKRELFQRLGLIQVAEASGMYGGGMVRGGYQTGGMVTDDPRMTAYNMANYTASIPGNQMMGYQTGGAVTTPPGVAPMTQEDFIQMGQQGASFQLPPSGIFTPSAPQTATAPTTTPTTLYGPTGDVIVLMLPTDQVRYNELLSQGYTTEPRPQVDVQVESDGGGGDPGVDPTTPGGGFGRLNDDDLESLRNNPLGFGADALDSGLPFGVSGSQIGAAGAFLAGMPGMVAGGVAAAALEVTNVAKARAALEVAKSQNLEGTEAYTALENSIKSAVDKLSPVGKLLDNLGFGKGTSFAEQATTVTPPTTTATVPTVSPGAGTPRTPVSDAGLSKAASMTEAEKAAARAYAETGSDREETWSGGQVGVTAADKEKSESVQGGAAAAGKEYGGMDISSESYSGKGYTSGRATGGLVAKPSRKKPVAKKK